MPKTLPLGKIRTDGGTQVRVELDKETFLDYGRQMAAGVEFPPVDVFHDGSTYWLADGFHRFFGARDNGLTEIAVKVHRGTVRDAILFAIGANATHGKPRTNKDKRHAVEMLLADETWREWSDVKLAETAAVSDRFVASMKEEHRTVRGCEFPETTIGKDGKRRKKPKRKPKKATLPTPTFVDEEPDPSSDTSGGDQQVSSADLAEREREPDAAGVDFDEPEELEDKPTADGTEPYHADEFADRLRRWCRTQLDNLDLTPDEIAAVMEQVATEVREW